MEAEIDAHMHQSPLPSFAKKAPVPVESVVGTTIAMYFC